MHNAADSGRRLLQKLNGEPMGITWDEGSEKREGTKRLRQFQQLFRAPDDSRRRHFEYGGDFDYDADARAVNAALD